MSILQRIKSAFSFKNESSKSSLPAMQPKEADKIKYYIDLEKRYSPIGRSELETFLQAYALATDPHQPQRWAMQEIYTDVINRDPHLKAIIGKRIKKVTNRDFRITDGQKELEVTELFRAKWFRQILANMMQAKFFGYSLTELSTTNIPNHFKVSNFERKHVDIDFHVILRDFLDTSYIYNNNVNNVFYYLSNPKLRPFFIETRFDSDDLGILEIAAPLAILKRHSWASWDEFEKIFGVPMRVLKTPSRDPEQRMHLENFLRNMGTASYGVMEFGHELEIHPSQSTDAFNVFDKKIERVNSELSKLILGSTTTSDTASNGNRNLGEIHQTSEEEITLDDLKDIQDEVNEILLPHLAYYFNFPIPKGAKFEFYEKMDRTHEEKRTDIDMLLRNGYKMESQFIEEVFEVKLEKPQAVQTPTPKPTKVIPLNAEFQTPENEAIIAQIIKDIFAGKQVSDAQLKKILQAYFEELSKGITEGFGSFDVDTPDAVAYEFLKQNVEVFAFAKTQSEMLKATNLLFDSEKGQFRAFGEFRNEVLKLHKNYNENYLQAEYNFAVGQSQMGRDWLGIEASKDVYPLLRYRTVKDELVRPEHKALEGVTLPIDHEFWNTYYPKNGWNCRCFVQKMQRNAKVTADADIPNEQIDEFFRNNVGKTKIIFPESHPYFKDINKDFETVKTELDELKG